MSPPASRPRRRPDPPLGSPRPDHCIDRAWCDVQGAYLQGWAHLGSAPFDGLALCCAGQRQPLDLHDRPDVHAAFPGLPPGQPVGFAGYLACPPFQPVSLELRGGGGVLAIPVAVGPGCGPRPVPGTGGDAPVDAFADAMKARGGAVLEIGARVVGRHSSLNAARFAPECRFIGCDIHPAPGVDLVADAHFLSHAVAPGSLDGVFSMAVLEHLAAPWLVAAEVNRVLRPGGETLHLVPQAWPMHERPNDFWRFSDAALAVLFGPATGFEVLEARLSVPVQVVPPPSFRHGAYLHLPLEYAFGAAWIRARKVAELPPAAVAWPLARAQSEQQSRAYPAQGLAQGPAQESSHA